MQIKDLINLIKTDVSGFTNKTDDIKDHYLVKIKMNDYVYESQSIFYALFENSEEFSDADNIAFANINFHNSVVLISILGTIDKKGFFSPLNENHFEGEIESEIKNEELYVRDFAVSPKNIAHIEIVTYL